MSTTTSAFFSNKKATEAIGSSSSPISGGVSVGTFPTIEQILNTSITSIADGDALVYEASSQLWKNVGLNRTQWDAAYDDKINSIVVTGAGNSKVITLNQQDGGALTANIEFTDTNFYVSTASFNTSNGQLSLGRTGGLGDVNVDLDGRYITAETDTLDSVTSRGASTANPITLAGTLSTAEILSSANIRSNDFQIGTASNHYGFTRNATSGDLELKLQDGTVLITINSSGDFLTIGGIGAYSTIPSGGGGGGASTLDELTDVTITSVTNNDFLIYNSTSGQWENGDLSLKNLTVNGLTALIDPIDAQGDFRARSNIRFDAYAPTSGHNLLQVGTDGTLFTLPKSDIALQTDLANYYLASNPSGYISNISGFTTSDLTEGSNLYFTNSRARAALSFSAGSGAYNSSTGVITIPTNNNQITNGAGYITSYTETDTLDSVTGRGNITTNGITVGNTTINGNLAVNGNLLSLNKTGTTGNKLFDIVSASYSSAEEDVVMFTAVNRAGFNYINYGGGSGSSNAATQHRFFAASSVNTLGGTQILTIDTNGLTVLSGVISGNGSALTNINASNISSGTISDSRLSSNVALKNINNNFSVGQTIGGNTTINGNLTVDTNTLFVNATNNRVGIGTSSPAFPLQISAASGNIVGVFETTTGNTNRLYLGAESTESYIDATAGVGSTNLVLKVASTERMRIDSLGNVGIGTSSPSAKLDVNGDVIIGEYLSGGDGEILVGQDASSYYLFAGFGADVSKPIRIGDNPTYISIHTANSERMRIDSSGNVGIGTSSPTTKLDVNGSGLIQSKLTVGNTAFYDTEGIATIYGSGKNQLIIQTSDNLLDRGIAFRNSGGAYISYINAEDAGSNLVDLVFGVSDSTETDVNAVEERMRIDSSGNVGIGTSSPSFTVANKGIHIADATSPAIRLQDSNAANSDFTIYSPNGVNDLRIYHENQARDLFKISSSQATFDVNTTINGNITVNGRIKGNVDSFTPNDQLIFELNPNSKAQFVNSTGSGTILSIDEATRDVVMVGNTTINGNLTIEGLLLTDSDDRSGLLEVHRKGSSAWSGYSIDHDGQHWSFMGKAADVGLYDDTNSEWIYRYDENATLALYHNGSVKLNTTSSGISVTGSITATGNVSAYSTSDARFKDIIGSISSPLERLSRLGGYEFTWNKDIHSATKGQRDIGVVAQEVEAEFPELVRTNPEGIKQVDYAKLSAVLIEAVKELNEKIERLENNGSNN